MTDLLKRADEWSALQKGTTHWENCYLAHVPCLIRALADRVRELEADREALLKIKAAAQELSDNAEEWDCDGLGLFAQHGWWEPLHDALEVLNDDPTT